MASVSRAAAPIAICAAAAGLSLLLPWALAFDPQVWVMWGHAAIHGHLDTAGGPSWKPLPVLATTLLAPAGDASEMLWLLVARTGGLMALVGAAALGERLAGRVAAIAAVVAMALSPWWLFNTALGNSEGLLAAFVLFAVVAHLDGRHTAALALGVAAGLLRPEIWPFVGLYGLWLFREGRRAAPVAALAVLAFGWFLPDALGTGGVFAASETARKLASPGSAQLAKVPFLAVLWDAVQQVTIPAFVAILVVLRRPTSAERWIAIAAGVYVLEVAISSQAGYAGNPRYLVPAAALGAALAGAGVARLAPRWRYMLAVALVALQATTVADAVLDVRWRADQRASIGAALARAGGERRLKACGPVRSTPFWRALVATRLHLGMVHVMDPPRAPGVLVRSPPGRTRPFELGPPPSPFVRVVGTPRWEVWTTCPRL